MKTVFIKSRFNGIPLHRLYYEIKKNPPEGYNFLISDEGSFNRFGSIASHEKNPIFKKILYYTSSIPYIIYQLRDNVKIPHNTDLVFTAQHIISSKKPWIVDIEHAGTLSGYGSLALTKKIILKKLEQNNCKKIIAWSDWSKRTIEKTFSNDTINKKISIVRYTVSPKIENNVKKDDTVRIFFLGTINPGTKKNYEFKGLYETVVSFLELQKEYNEKIHLIIRSTIPDELREKITGNNGITLYENYISKDKMKDLWLNSDIFPHAGYEVLNLSVLEAMSYGLPVIITNLFNSPELIQNMKNGILLDVKNSQSFYTKDELPNERSMIFTREMRNSREYLTKKLTESMKTLIEDEGLRRQISKESKKTINEGEFSITERNSRLKKILDEAVG